MLHNRSPLAEKQTLWLVQIHHNAFRHIPKVNTLCPLILAMYRGLVLVGTINIADKSDRTRERYMLIPVVLFIPCSFRSMLLSRCKKVPSSNEVIGFVCMDYKARPIRPVRYEVNFCILALFS